MSLVNDIVSVENFVKATFPDARTEKNTPRDPYANLIVVRFLNQSRESETSTHTRAEREYQVVYYDADEPTVLAKMDALDKALYQTMVIPIKDSLRYIRVESFSFSNAFQTQSKDIYACIGILSTSIREARDQVEYDKIMHVHARYLT